MHGTQYTSYDSQQRLRLLDGLLQTNHLKILILDETGMGKSTSISALVDYLEFETFDEVIEAQRLNYVIPCSFATQTMDRSDPERPSSKVGHVGASYEVRAASSDCTSFGKRGESCPACYVHHIQLHSSTVAYAPSSLPSHPQSAQSIAAPPSPR